jgi:hypothetical protein
LKDARERTRDIPDNQAIPPVMERQKILILLAECRFRHR